VTLAWVSGDTVYGNDRRLRWLKENYQAYVLAVAGLESLVDGSTGATWQLKGDSPSCQHKHGSNLVVELAVRNASTVGVKMGQAGQQPGWSRWLLARRSLTDPAWQAYFGCFAWQHIYI